MKTILDLAELLRGERVRAGVTQRQLAQRMGTTQSAVAALERRGTNVTMRTVADAFDALGLELRVRAVARPRGVDESLIRRHLELSPADRLGVLEGMASDVAALTRS
jgi:transcriptional regulator with XRE-family HTH domain